MNEVYIFSAVFLRVVWITILTLCLVWIVKYMGGFALSPEDVGPNANDTSKLFNWHPLLMILAFPVFMTEALCSYIAAPISFLPRFRKKAIHASLQVVVLVFIVLGYVAVFRSHNQKKPKAMDDLYSPHSYMGITTFATFTCQLFAGITLFGLPGISEETKKIYAQFHRFFGMVTYVMGCATILAGIQEKNTFNQAFGGKYIHKHGLYEPLFAIPAVMAPLIIILVTAVAFHRTFLKIEPKSVATEGPSEPSTGTQEPLMKREAGAVV